MCYINTNPVKVVTSWMDIYKGIIDRYIPSKIITIKPRNKPWFNKRVRTSIRTKHRLFNKYKKHPSAENWSKYKRARNSSVSIIREAKKEYHEKIQNELLVSNLTSKKFWSLTKGLLGAKVTCQYQLYIIMAPVFLIMLKRLNCSIFIFPSTLPCLIICHLCHLFTIKLMLGLKI